MGIEPIVRWLGFPAVPLAMLAFAVWTVPAEGSSAIGVNTDITWGIAQSAVAQEVSLIKQSGVTWVRASVDLSGAEYAGPGQLNSNYLSGIDYAVQSARNGGLNVLLELDRAPYWASADPSKYSDSSGYHYNPYYRYTNNTDYANIAAALVKRYAAMGVHAYEVWNEPNNQSFWPSGVNAAQYTALLKAAYPAIKTADPSSTVLPAGLMNQTSYDFLQGMYDAGAKGSYDAQNVHLYPADPRQCNLDSNGRQSVNSFCLLDGLHAEMTANTDSTPVWITEIGWSTCSQSYCSTQAQQATYLTSALGLISGGKYPYVQNTLIYQIRNNPYDTASSDWGSSLGLLNLDFSVKPAYTALQQATAGPPVAPSNVSPPAISGTPTDGQTLTTTDGSWSGSAPLTYSYQWQRCDSSGAGCQRITDNTVSGAGGQSYALISGDVGHTIRAVVTATNSAGSTSASSASTATIAAVPPANTAPPRLSGTASQGHDLATSDGSWRGTAPLTYTYQWQRCNAVGSSCTDIAGARTGTYTLTFADVGSTVRAIVTARNAAGSSSAATATSQIATPAL